MADAWTATEKAVDDKRLWRQLAAVSELKEGDASERQLLRRFKRIVGSGVRPYIFGYTVGKNELRLYLLTPSALVTSPKIDCSGANQYKYVVFLRRLLSFNDEQLGVLYSGIESGVPFHRPAGVKPAVLVDSANDATDATEPSFANPLLDQTITIGRSLRDRSRLTGRCTSAFEVRVDGKPLVMTASFQDQSRQEVHDEIRNLIYRADEKDREGLCKARMIWRGKFEVVPQFVLGEAGVELPSHLPSSIHSRALEITVFEECYEPLETADTPLKLAKAIQGAAQGESFPAVDSVGLDLLLTVPTLLSPATCQASTA